MNHSMTVYRYHRYLGYLLILPITLWALTGAIFLVKPGYKMAYEQLQIITYPLTSPVLLQPDNQWQDLRISRSVIATHYRVKIAQQWQQINIQDNSVLAEPTPAIVVNLLQDAIKHDPQRYGSILSYQDGVAVTDTEVKLMFDWHALSLRQQGGDSRFFNMLYNIHYLRWTGNEIVDQCLGYLGLLLLIAISFTGICMIRQTHRANKG